MNATSKKIKERAAVSAVAAVASASMLISGTFASPEDLMDGDDSLYAAPIADTVDPGDDGDAAATDEEETQQRRGIRTRARQIILSLPVGVRACVGVPLWCIGWLLMTVLSALWTSIISPVMGIILPWLTLALVLLCVFALTGKAMFPDLPVKKLLSRRCVLGVLAGVLLLGLVDTLLPFAFGEGYERISNAVKAAGSFVVVLLPTLSLLFREIKKRCTQAEKEAKTDELEAARRRVLEMADSVR